MAVSNLPIFPQSWQDFQLANATTATANVIVGGVNGSRVDFILITNTDTVDHSLLVSMNVAGTLTPLANVNIPANSGNGVINTVSLFANNQFAGLPVDAAGNRFLYLSNGSCGLTVSNNVNPASAKVVALSGQASVY